MNAPDSRVLLDDAGQALDKVKPAGHVPSVVRTLTVDDVRGMEFGRRVEYA